MVECRKIHAGAGYLAFCVVLAALALTVSVLSLTQPADPRDSWWVSVGMLVIGISAVWVLARAPFVGLVVFPTLVVHRTWIRSKSYRVDEVASAFAALYSGRLSRGAELPFFAMVRIQLRSGVEIPVPEVSGSPRTVIRLVEDLGLPHPA